MTRVAHNVLVLAGLREGFKPKVEAWLAECELTSLPIWLVEGLRTNARQYALFTQGRAQRTDGSWYIVDQKQVVTNAMSAQDGPHPRGAAVDFCPTIGGVLMWKREDLFHTAGQLARKHGLRWGGDFKDFRAKALGDLDHIEDPQWRSFPLPASSPVS